MSVFKLHTATNRALAEVQWIENKEQEGNKTLTGSDKYARDVTAKPDRQEFENTQGIRDCHVSRFYTKPVDLLTLKSEC